MANARHAIGAISAVIGNCGFGIAPVKEEGRERAMLSLTRNEAISYDAMAASLAWDWESFPESGRSTVQLSCGSF